MTRTAWRWLGIRGWVGGVSLLGCSLDGDEVARRSAQAVPIEQDEVLTDGGVSDVAGGGWSSSDGLGEWPDDVGDGATTTTTTTTSTSTSTSTDDGGDPGGEGPPGLCCDIGGIYFWNTNLDPRLQCSSTTTIADEASCIAANSGSAPPFQVWSRGDAATDQSAALPRQSSGLVTIEPAPNHRLSDHRFAQLLGAHVDTALSNTPGSTFRFVGMFAECYGGGMFDDLVSTFGNETLSGVPLLLSSASRYDEVAYYPDMMNPTDWGWGLQQTLAQSGSGFQLALGAAERDDFRVNGSEHPQYIAVSGGDTIGLADEAVRIAVLWSGKPKKVDREQIRDIVLSLVNDHGYAPKSIFVFYGDGNLRLNHELRQLQIALAQTLGSQFEIRRANETELLKLFNTAFNGGWAVAPEQLFFFANDHGYNTAAKPTARAGGSDDNEEDDQANDPSPGPGTTPSYPDPFGP
jgi:hypothetical protein